MDDTSTKIVTQEHRQMEEMAAILGNEKHAKNAARSLALRTLYYPMPRPQARFILVGRGPDAESMQTDESIREQEAWDRCKLRCKPDQNPTMWDVMNDGQAFAGITAAGSYSALRDTAGLKPIDESKMVIQPENPYANMSDEELQELAEFRKLKEERDGSKKV
jgi:hypothetical protein